MPPCFIATRGATIAWTRAGSAGARNTRICRRPSRAAVRNARGRRQNDESMREDSRNGTQARQEHHLESRRTIRALSRTITARPEHSLDIEHDAHIGRRTRSSRIARRAPDGPEKKKPRKSENLRGFVTAFGGDGGIRTLDPGFGPDAPLAGECLRPLGHVSQTFARTREAVRRERNNIGFRTARQFP